jgi:hypothetical protein
MWYVVYSSEDISGDSGRAVEALSIGPYPDDHADTFAFSENFTEGIPNDVVAKFVLMAAAPALLASCKAMKAFIEMHGDVKAKDYSRVCLGAVDAINATDPDNWIP